MSAQAIPAESDNDPGPRGPTPYAADTQGYHQVLQDLITMGADLARLLHGQATAHAAQQAAPYPAQHPADPHPTPPSEALITLTLAFDRIARAVRRSILLARSLASPIQPAPDPARHRAATRRRIIREVEDAIQRTASAANDGRDDPQTLQAELRDRLDTPDLDDDIATRPTADIISEICRDLGLAAPPGGAHPWKRRTSHDIAHLCTAAAAPSSTRNPAPTSPTPTSPASHRNHSGTAPRSTAPQPGQPAARPRPQPTPIHAVSNPPEDPATTLATILRHPTRVPGRWRPPPHH